MPAARPFQVAPTACAASSTTGEAARRADGVDGVEVGALPEQVHRHDRARAVGDGVGQAVRVQVERRRVDVDEHGHRAQHGRGLGGRDERERRADHLVAGAYAERHQRDLDRVGAVAHAERGRRAVGRAVDAVEVAGELGLEVGDERAAHEGAAVEHGRERGVVLGAEGVDLRAQVDHLEGHRSGVGARRSYGRLGRAPVPSACPLGSGTRMPSAMQRFVSQIRHGATRAVSRCATRQHDSVREGFRSGPLSFWESRAATFFLISMSS